MSVPLMAQLRGWFVAAAAALLVGCVGGGTVTVGPSGGDPQAGYSRVTIQAQYEKRLLTTAGFQGTSLRPARYQFIEIRQASNDSLLWSDFADSQGRVIVDVTNGSRIYARAVASFQVPNTAGGGFFQRGSVINAHPPASNLTGDQQVSYYSGSQDWAVSSDAITVNSSGTLTVTANASNRIAGAFNISEQMLALGLKVRDLEPALRLPNLHCYWTTSSNPGDQDRSYPRVLTFSNGSVAKLSSTNRAIFTTAAFGLEGGGAFTESDEWDDGALLESFSHLLFADASLKEDGSSLLSLLRRDNDDVFASRFRQSESTLAFQTGFADFLAGAVQGNALLLDSYRDGNGDLQVDAFDLTRHDQISSGERSEFNRGSVAITLWGIWKNALGGGSTGLSTLWSAARSNAALADGTGEYNGATLGCYPSYLTGVKSRNISAWPGVTLELGKENISEPTPAYFAGTALWQTQPQLPFTVNGSVQTYAASQNRYYDRNQSQAWRFNQISTGNRTITVNPTGGQDLWVELIGPGGVWGSSTAGTPATRTFTVNSLAPGVYAVRVRAGNTSATTNASYSLMVQ
ncbi:MAG: hypothetical protein IPL96_01960 [Holophagaceae bacterium]|nr:hypothetical protein [Holophagaceae bacterium]